MFDLDYIAANTGAEWSHKGDIFTTETVVADETGKVTLANAPVAVAAGAKAYLYYKDSENTNTEYSRIAADGKEVELGAEFADKTVCVMYRYTNDFADKITISSQFIPDTLHAILTVALYAGDSCNVETSTKIGQVEIDIPRFQLSGSMDLSMTASGAAQSSLEGNALASGCTGCDGKAVYATITRVIFDNTLENVTGLIIEDGDFELNVQESKEMVVYAIFENAAPHQLDPSMITWSVEGDAGEMDENVFKAGDVAGEATLTAVLTDKDSISASCVAMVVA